VTAILAVASVSACFCVSSDNKNDSYNLTETELGVYIENLNKHYNSLNELCGNFSRDTEITSQRDCDLLCDIDSFYKTDLREYYPELQQDVKYAYEATAPAFSSLHACTMYLNKFFTIFNEQVPKLDPNMSKAELASFVKAVEPGVSDMNEAFRYADIIVINSTNSWNALSTIIEKLEDRMNNLDPGSVQYKNLKYVHDGYFKLRADLVAPVLLFGVLKNVIQADMMGIQIAIDKMKALV